ncbi:ABC transporter, phosphonate, substrate-binding protein [Shimia gijangensis]|uniref:ABC transporter, phosphonate, substrate-binding protein n=1 Tax=Shimia gijangensis TaxID=1470563 RepID=A0A1M6DYM7_9RHOB|nr:PhnD/SsuA/transferrin family substrate-binding protein [Shimia gijangensis]SHI78367.1 ABC transporter, phosphonate, substrate-binding protein [Shimia gijangensis]
MIAMLGMYDRPETAAANDRLWQAIRGNLGFGPVALTRDRDFFDIWRARDLVFAQTCGMPFRLELHARVQLVGTPDYGLPDCPPGFYNSVIVARRDAGDVTLTELCDGVFAYNEPVSQSGWAAPMVHMQALGLTPNQTLQTGAHILSAQAVATGKADFAALDALTWALIQRYDAFADDLQVIAKTTPTPTLPFITGPGQRVDVIRAATIKAIANLTDADRSTLCLWGLTEIPASDYLAVPNPRKT